MDYRKKYMDIIIGISLNLCEGEGLSINTGEGNLQFAQDLAQMASEITKVPVSIVLVEEGKVKEVFSVTPVEHELISETSIQKVLLRLSDADLDNDLSDYSPDQIVSQPPLLQRAGNLGPPQLNREVAPFAVAAIPHRLWAEKVFGKGDDTLDRMWSLFASHLFLDREDTSRAWVDHLRFNQDLLRQIHRHESIQLHIYDSKTDLRVLMIEESRFRQRLSILDNQRSFISSLFDRGITMIPDSSHTSGIVYPPRPFRMLGQWVTNAKFVFENGKVVSYDADEGKEALEKIFAIDDGASKAGFLSFTDEHIFPHDIHYYGDPVIDDVFTSSLFLGMGDAKHMEALKTYEDEKELGEQTGVNISNFRGRVPIGSPSLCVDIIDEQDQTFPLMVNGRFILNTGE